MAWAHQRTSTYKVTANPPTPPNWTSSLDAATNQLSPYHKIQVPPNSAEFCVLSSMMGPVAQVTNIERVVNLQLWKKFTGARKDLLAAKSSDLRLLVQLGLSEEERQHKIHIDLNYKKDPGQNEIGPYSDNVVLLYHGSRAPLDIILTQGLDERLAANGWFGRGIYFADDPAKSLGYDGNSTLLVCMVYLGDCLPVSGAGLVREPQKSEQQQRNPADLFFDSVVATMPHEFVIFNRYQCYPIYAVSYQRGGGGHTGSYTPSINYKITPSATYAAARRQAPPFVWNGNGNGNFNPSEGVPYPFFAQNIFNEMRADEVKTPGSSQNHKHVHVPRLRQKEYKDTSSIASDSRAEGGGPMKSLVVGSAYDDEEMSIQISRLVALGFENQDKNLMAIRRFGDDFDSILDFLVTEDGNDDLNSFTMSLSDSHVSAVPKMTDGTRRDDTSGTEITQQHHQVDEIDETSEGQLASLHELGFEDIELNKQLLAGFGYDLEKTLDYLLHEADERNLDSIQEEPRRSLLSIVAEESTKNTCSNPNSTTFVDDNQLEECSICAMEYPKSALQKWKILRCKHKLCTTCYGHLQTTASTMSGQLHTFLKCPFCQVCSGDAEIGTCPNGSMTVSILSNTHESFGTLQITYNVSGSTTARIGYLPNSPEGQHVLQLLRAAWDRRLIFRIGLSNHATAVEWNITHQTSLNEDQDSNYLTRVQDELKQYGIQ